MKIAITAEDTIDVSNEILKDYDIKLIHPIITFNGEVYYNGEITSEIMFNEVNNNGVDLPKTSAMNPNTYEEFFAEVLKEYDALIHISLSGEISSMYRNAVIASNAFNGKVEVIDSMSLSSGSGLVAMYARELANTLTDVHEIAEKVRKRVPYVQASFVLERLDYLHKGGRCSSIALLGANVLKIRPQVILKDGKMISHKKYRGPMPIVVKKYCEDVLLEFNNPCKDLAFVTYSSATPEMEKVALEVAKNAGFKKIYVTTAGPTVSSHCGEHTIGLLYFNDGNA